MRFSICILYTVEGFNEGHNTFGIVCGLHFHVHHKSRFENGKNSNCKHREHLTHRFNLQATKRLDWQRSSSLPMHNDHFYLTDSKLWI